MSMTIIKRHASGDHVGSASPMGDAAEACSPAITLDDLDRSRVARDAMAELFDVELPPVCVGRYELVRRLGSGAMGHVHEAHDRTLDRRVALKLIDPATLQVLPEGARIALLREAQALARLSHPHVVQVYEVGLDDDPVFIAMELVDGKSLARWVAEDRPGWEEIVEVFRQAGEGLVAAHERGIVHRDFKPHNVMVGHSPRRVCVTDFGLARPAPASPTTTSAPDDGAGSGGTTKQSRRWAGTPAYMAPEQLDDVATAHGDQFAFCASLYHALYDVLPYPAASITGVQAQKLAGPPTPVDAQGVPRWVLRVIGRGLAPDPDARWPTMRALLTALDPRRRRRRWQLGIGGTVLLATGSAITLGALHAGHTAPCAEVTATLDAAWSPAQRQAVVDRLGEGSPVVAALDARVAEWQALRAAACEDQHAQAEGALRQVAAARAECLDERAVTLAEIVATLPHASLDELAWARASADDLVSLDPCRGDVPATLELDAPLRDALARAEAYAALGRFEDARSLADEVLTQPRRGGPRWYHAWAGILRAKAALELAERAGHDYLAYLAWATLANVGRLGEPRPALAQGVGFAEAAHRRIHDDPTLAALRERRLRILRANVDVLSVDPVAQQHAEQQLAAVADDPSAPELDVASARQGLLALAIRRRDLDTAGDLAARIDGWIARRYGDVRPSTTMSLSLGEALLDVGLAHLLACRLPEALDALERARTAWSGLLPAGHELWARSDAAIAEVQIKLGRFERARARVERQVEGQAGLGHAAALLSLGVVDFGEGQLDDAQRHMTRAGEIFESEARPDLAMVAWLGVAEVELHLSRFDAAIARIEAWRPWAAESVATPLLHKLDGLVALRAGRWHDAARSLDSAAEGFGPCEPYELGDSRLAQAAALRHLERTSEAEAAAAAAASAYDALEDAGALRLRRMQDLLAEIDRPG